MAAAIAMVAGSTLYAIAQQPPTPTRVRGTIEAVDGDMLAVSFYSAEAGGIVLYRIEGQRLVGHWSAPLTDGKLFEETLTRMGDVPAATP